MKKQLFILIAIMIALTACSKTTSEQMKQGGAGSADHGGHGGNHGEEAKAGVGASVQALWKLSSAKPMAKQNTTLTLQIQDGQGKPIEKFDINHEKQMHLIVVSKDLSYFDHIHPEYKGKGVFEVSTAFPAGGEYKLVADFIPAGMTATTQTHWIQVEGEKAPQVQVQPEARLAKTADGKNITLTTDGQLAAGKELTLKFHMEDAATNQPVTNLQPYLGAVGHVVIMSADAEQYLHVHPMDEKSTGPDALFMTTFPKAGIYKVWGQFQQNGKVFIVSYVIQVS